MMSELELTEGAKLWVLSKQNPHRERLNWLLNFQISEADHHQPHELPKRIQEILNNCELRNLDFIESPPKGLLIAARNYLPTEWVLLVSHSELVTFIQETWTAWTGLNRLTTRIFLPPSVKISHFRKEWTRLKNDDLNAFQLVEC